MDVILIPGFWLDASSWGEIPAVLERAGHRVHALTLPGLESRDADRRGIRLRDHVEAVVAALDEADGTDPQVVSDERRYDVPATIIACEFPSDRLRVDRGGAPLRGRACRDAR